MHAPGDERLDDRLVRDELPPRGGAVLRRDRYSRVLQVSLVVLGCLAYVGRGEYRLFHPILHSEDGTVFLAGQWNDGLGSFGRTYAGYLNLGPRLIAVAASQLPLTAIPFAYALASVVIYLAVASQVVSARLSWLIPSRSMRAAAFVLLCALAPNDETYGNIANLIAVTGLGLFLASMSSDPKTRRGRGFELVACAIAGLTGPFGLFLAPLFWYRWAREARSRHSLRVAVIISALGIVQAVVVSLSSRPMPGGHFLPTLSRALVERFAGGWLFNAQPVFTTPGPHLGYIVAAVAWLAATFWAVFKLRGPGLALAGSVVLLMAVAAHAYGAEFIDSPTADRRQLLVPMAVLVVGLCAVIARAPSRSSVVVAVAALALGASSMRASMTVYPYAKGSDMAALQHCLKSGQAWCSIDFFGRGWTLTLRQKG